MEISKKNSYLWRAFYVISALQFLPLACEYFFHILFPVWFFNSVALFVPLVYWYLMDTGSRWNAFAVALMAVLLVAIPSIEAVPQEWHFARFPVTFILFLCIKYDPRINTPKKTADGGSPGRAWSAIPGVLFSLRVPLVVLAVLYGTLYIWLKFSRDIHLLVRAADAKGISALLASGADPDRRDGRGRSPLHTAVDNGAGPRRMVPVLLEGGASPDATDRNGDTPLHTVFDRCSRQREPPEGCRFPDMEGTATLLLEAGGDVNAKNSAGRTALFHAARLPTSQDAEKALAFLLDRGADADARDGSGNTPLHALAQGGNEDSAALLLSRGADADAKNDEGDAPLHLAAHKTGTDRMTAVLLEGGASPNAKDKNGDAPLHTVFHGCFMPAPPNGCGFSDIEKKATLLLEAGGDVNANNSVGPSVLYNTISYYLENRDAEKALAFLLDRGADADAKDRLGNTPLHILAQSEGSAAPAALLLSRGADANAKNKWGNTPLLNAAKSPNDDAKEVVSLLLGKGADANAKNNRGDTPLLNAAKSPNDDAKEVVSLLLGKGADANAKDTQGDTPLHTIFNSCNDKRDQKVCGFSNIEKMATLLLEAGGDVNAKNSIGQTPLFHAVYFLPSQDADKALAFLLDKGADIGVRDRFGETPLHTLARGAINSVGEIRLQGFIPSEGFAKVVALLLAKGADANAKNAKGYTPLHLSLHALHVHPDGNLETMLRLVEGGADVHRPDESGKSFLSEFKRLSREPRFRDKKGYRELAKLLGLGGRPQ